MRLLFISQSLLFCYLLTTALVYAETTVVEPAQTAFDKGQFEDAISLWQKAFSEKSQKTPLNIQIKLASAYQKLGFYQKAFNLLQASLTRAKIQKNNQAHTIILSEIATLYLSGYQDKKNQGTTFENEDNPDNLEKANEHLNKAIEIARQTNDKLVIAKVLNKQGNLLFIEGNYEDAIITYKESEQLAREVGDLSLMAKVLINITNTMILEDEVKVTVVKQLMEALDVTKKLKASHDKSFGLMALSNMTSDIPDKFISKSAKRWFQYTALKFALESAEKDIRAKSYAYGYIGKLYEDDKRYNEALQLTRQALFLALETALPELMYRWYWQWGRVLKAQGEQIRAIKMYQSAIHSIRENNIRDCNRSIIPSLFNTGYRSRTEDKFYDKLGKLYFELADLLIEEGDLQRALDTVEYLKIVEFQDYFKDDCIVEKKPIKPFEMPTDSAILYPILLPDRIELLLKLPTNYIKRFVVFLEDEKKDETVDEFVNNTASSFNGKLREPNSVQYKEKAQKLYEWLIAPIERTLNQHHITTLVVVPDRQLRRIPFAALHDGEKFLIQKYAIAILPSLKLSYPKALSRQSVQVFIGGISVPVKIANGKKSIKLPSVPEALNKIQNLYPENSKKFLDAKLTKSIFEQEMESPLAYTIVHIASHSYFALDPKDSYLLLYNEDLKMDRLEELLKYGRLNKPPVELLTLSACETAKGDDHKAGLGLAGVSIKAGVESTLANLWLVDDRAATELSVAFYEHLQNQKLTKAQALQEAQKELMKTEKFQHPYYWAPLILIGNWR
ncbi:MAG: CHAT domain-containing protein [Candidatus Parabeggiatoa sp.]|nr:CHAT domain-containing protein [Candidatus Parabeggiatoa sp.]